jgi:hypothetical protein
MNKELIFLCTSLAFLVFSVISILTAPVINNKDNGIEMSGWGKLNCKFYSDMEKNAAHIDDIQKYKKLKDLCNRKKAMSNLEYSSLVIDVVLGFISAQLGLLLYFKIGGSIDKVSGIFGMIAGIICFILTFIYMCYSGYIFDNDIAFKKLTPGTGNYYNIVSNGITKKYPNGATDKMDGDTKVPIYKYEIGDDIEYIKYKNLGEKQYNYDKKYSEGYTGLLSACKNGGTGSGCSYFYNKVPPTTLANKYLYDNWVTSLIFSCFSFLAAIGLIVIGALLFFKNKDGDNQLIPNTETIQITNKE